MAFSLRRRRAFGLLACACALVPAAAAHAQTQLTFSANADARVKSTSATKNYGSDKWLEVGRGKKPNDPISLSYLSFDVAGVSDGTVSDATLRLLAKDSSSYGANVLQVANDWDEASLTWDAAPAPITPVRIIGSVQAIVPGVVDIPLDPSIFTQDGRYSFALGTPALKSVRYSSREGKAAPQLILTVAPPDTSDDSPDTSDAPPPPPPPAPKPAPRCRRAVHHSSSSKNRRPKAHRAAATARKPRQAHRAPGRRPPGGLTRRCVTHHPVAKKTTARAKAVHHRPRHR
jgi:hypothetical protein